MNRDFGLVTTNIKLITIPERESEWNAELLAYMINPAVKFFLPPHRAPPAQDFAGGGVSAP